MPFTFTTLDIKEIILIHPKKFDDSRGFFLETFKKSSFNENGISTNFFQDNFSHSTKGVLRGLHYQINPFAQAKLVSVLFGEIFDVAVDIRLESPTYGKWVGVILSHKNHNMLFIPEGFAHGFCVLSNSADVYYKTSNEYSPEHEQGIIWNDPEININWPIKNPIITDKDLQLPTLKNTNHNFS